MLDRTGIMGRFNYCDSLDAATPQAAAAVAPRRRPRRALFVFDAALALAIICGAVYLFWQLGAYRGQLDQLQQLTPMQRLVANVSRRLDAAEDIWRNWGHEKDALLQRFEKGEDNSRRHAENLVAASEQHIKSEIEQRNGELQGRMDRIEATQQANSERMTALEQQMERLNPSSNSNPEPSANRMEPAASPTGASHADIDDLNHHLTQVEQQTSQTQRDLEAMRSKLDRKRVEFEMNVNRARELAPGISLVVNATNVPQQRFDGRIWLAQDKQSLWIRGQGPQQPLVFYSKKDDLPRELVVTKVTANSISGYLLLPAAPTDAGGGE